MRDEDVALVRLVAERGGARRPARSRTTASRAAGTARSPQWRGLGATRRAARLRRPDARHARSRCSRGRRRLRLTATVFHMEQVGPRRGAARDRCCASWSARWSPSSAPPCCATSAPRSTSSNWSASSFLREFGVLLTAIILAGRTAQRVHRADRRDAEPRGGRCDPHAGPGPDRPAGDAARARAAGDAAAARPSSR